VDLRPGQDGDAVFRRLEEQLLSYRIFPPALMRADVCSEDGRVHEGTTIVQHVAIGPFPLEAAVRVVRVWRTRDDDVEEVGFTYATLKGHPERGTSTFRVCRRRDRDKDQIAFLIEARSRPGSLLTRLTRPLARRFQRRATEAALSYFTALAD
jgi:uncharacterized protein (UPF0548 family)